jgi:hypothetical protein
MFPATLCAASLLFAALAGGQQPRATEYEVKAVYLFNFGRFVSWPAPRVRDSAAPFAICVIGKDPFGPVLDAALAGETIEGRTVVARRVALPEQATTCQELYIPASEGNHLRDILSALDKSSVLTVSDIEHFSERGGMIQFVVHGDRVRFQVNLTRTADAGLTLSSELLKVAVAVRRSAPPGE